MKAVLIRVGIDSQYGGNVGPIFKDGSFEYVPIPEYEKSNEKRIYSDTNGQSGKLLSNYVGKIFKNTKIHFDPEFETFTYGDHLKKSKIFASMDEEDYLIFYSGLKPYMKSLFPRGLYVIGYFCISDVFDFDDLQHDMVKEKLKNNAHLKRGDITKDTVILQGYPEKSRLLKKAIHISKEGKEHWIASNHFCNIIGRPYNYNLLRSSPRVIEGNFAEKLVNFILHTYGD
jgi:hypothetical protein